MVNQVKSPQFSILLPTHNRADVIGCAIESVLNQKFRNFEILVIGDGCTDQTETVVNKYVKKDKRVRWFAYPKAAGFGYSNRNQALKSAKGQWVAYIGHDDLWLPNHLSLHAEFLQNHPHHLISYSRPLWMSEKGILIPSFFNTDAALMRKIFWSDHNEIPAVCFVVKKEAIKKAGSWILGTRNAGDWDLWRRIIRLDPQKRIGFIGLPTAINFKSNWRGENQYLSEHLRMVLQIIETSPSLLKVFKLPRTIRGSNTLQQDTWLQIKHWIWVRGIFESLPSAREEISYRLTLANHVLMSDRERIFSFIRKVKSSEIYKAYYSFLKWKAKSLEKFAA